MRNLELEAVAYNQDRLMRMLCCIQPNGAVDSSELNVQQQSTAVVHELAGRASPADLLQKYWHAPALLAPSPVIGIFIDVLTTDAHFKAAQSLLQPHFPNTRIIGVFIAHRVPETADPHEFDVL